MSRFLLQIALGPVQDFIQQARRTRDLWFGSHILSELSRSCARSLATSGFELVFPALPADDRELAPCIGMRRPNGDMPREQGEPPLAVSNIILAASPADMGESAVESAAEKARVAVAETWDEFARAAVKNAGSLLRNGTNCPAAIEHLLECYAAWVEIPDGPSKEQLATARVALGGAIASRKSLRHFAPWPGRVHEPKSSLDGYRENVLFGRAAGEVPTEQQLELARDVRIPTSEHLDEIGFVKRCGGEPDQFVPLARIALDPWIAATRTATGAGWTRMVRELRAIFRDTTLAECSANTVPWLGDFPFDGEVFFEDQWQNHPRSDRDPDRNRASEKRYEAFTATHLRPLLRGRTPDSYLACLHADGDRMGQALSGCADLAALIRASESIAAFSRDVRETVVTHKGSLVFAGGDDVLAFLPVTTAVQCAAALAVLFAEHMSSAFLDLAETDRPTLSVGIGIAHVLDPMGEHIERAKRAEKIAKTGTGPRLEDKEDRNALAIISSRRGGAEVTLRRQWTTDPARRIDEWSAEFAAADSPHALPYEVRTLLRRMPATSETDETWRAILLGELRKMLIQKRVRGIRATSSDSDLTEVWNKLGLDLHAGTSYAGLVRVVEDWLEAALVIRHIALARRAVERAGRSSGASATAPEEAHA